MCDKQNQNRARDNGNDVISLSTIVVFPPIEEILAHRIKAAALREFNPDRILLKLWIVAQRNTSHVLLIVAQILEILWTRDGRNLLTRRAVQREQRQQRKQSDEAAWQFV